MKKNFVVTTATESQFEAVLKWATANGYDGLGKVFKRYDADTAIAFLKGVRNEYAASDFYRRNNGFGPFISFEAFAAIHNIELGPKSVTIYLSADHNATVDYQQQLVVVGSQKIPFAKVKEVYELTQKHPS